jgi:hypothetical protein
MSHHIHILKVAELDPFHPIQKIDRLHQPRLLRIRQIDLRDVAGNHRLRVGPNRVRNIFICSVVVFCASSMMMKASFSVRPRINASGATSMMFFSSILSTFSGSQQIVERVIKRPQIRIDLLLQAARQKAQPLARLHRRPHQDNPAHLLGIHRRHRHGDRQIRLARTRRPHAEGHIVLLNRLNIFR